jgi:hypothetical protein
MKTLNKFILLGLITSIVACGGPEDNNKPESSNESSVVEENQTDTEGMEVQSLNEFELPGSILLPMTQKPDIIKTDWGSIEIRIGDNFGIEIMPSGLSVAEHKEELAKDLVYSVEYLEETNTLLSYKKAIKDSDIKSEHHFFMNMESDGELYEIKSLAEGSFSKINIDKMIKAATSLKMNEPEILDKKNPELKTRDFFMSNSINQSVPAQILVMDS